MFSQMNTSMKSFELSCFTLLSSICLKVFLFCVPASQQRGSLYLASNMSSPCGYYKLSQHKQIRQEHLGSQRCYNKAHCVETLSKTPKRARFQDKEHLTHRKLSGSAIWCLLALSLLSLQLGQQTPQYPGLMLHGLLHNTRPGTDHLSQAC